MRKRIKVSQVILSYVASSTWLVLTRAPGMRFAENGQRHAQRMLSVLQVNVTTRGSLPSGGAVVANHLSYLDIIVLMAALPCRFVTFTEMRSMPGIGLLVGLSRTLLVNRSRPGRVKEDIRLVTEALHAPVPVVFFPEGASFDGDFLRPFRPALFAAVAAAGAPLNPCCLRYTDLEGESVTTANRHRLYYFGDMNLVGQLWSLINTKSISVELVCNPPIETQEQGRKELAELSHTIICRDFLPVVPV